MSEANIEKFKLMDKYLRFLDNFFVNISQNKENLLFVEGFSDKKFFVNAFKSTNLEVNERNIFYNFSPEKNNYKGVKYNQELCESFGDAYRNKKKSDEEAKKIEDEATEIVKETKEKFKNYDFVIVATHCAKKKAYKNIDCFGFVDRDFGKLDIDGSPLLSYNLDNSPKSERNISVTQFHDRETTLIFYYLPKLYCSLKTQKSDADNNFFIEKMGEILYFSTCQGILENYSQKYSSLHMYKVTYENFRDPSKWSEMKKYGDVTSFDFGSYLNELKIVENDKFKIAFLEKCNTDIKNLNKLELVFKEEVKEWLENNVHSKLLEDAFLKSNGHILCESIVKVLDKYLSIKSKKDYELINLLIPLIKEYDQDFKDASPVKEYLQYRKDLKNT